MKRTDSPSSNEETMLSIRILMVNDVLIAYGIRTPEDRERIFKMSMHELTEKWNNRPSNITSQDAVASPSPTP